MANHNPQTNPNSLQNLQKHKWKKGECPNPGGMGRYNLGTEFKKFLLSKGKTKSGDEMERINAMMQKLFVSAMEGDNRSMEILLERGFGKPKQDIDLNGGEGLQIVVTSGIKNNLEDYGKGKGTANAG